MGPIQKSLVLASRTDDRRWFAREALRRWAERLPAGRLLVKPNLVSREPYPTTTHPDLLDEVLDWFSGRDLVVADGPAVDVLKTNKAMREHALTRTCEDRGRELINLHARKMIKLQAGGARLAVSGLVKETAAMVSMPVLKSHKVCMMTGALKNHFGLLSKLERVWLHIPGVDINKAIAALHLMVPPCLTIMDAVVTNIGANERRHGGSPVPLGYMLAGTDPVALDAAGLSLLREVDPKLRGKQPLDVAHIRCAAELGIGSLEPEVEWVSP